MVDFLNKLDRRIIFFCILLATALPLVYQVKMPIRVTDEVKNIKLRVDALPEGAKILFSADYDPASGAELDPMCDALLQYLFTKNLKIVAMGLWPQGPGILQEKIARYAKEQNKTYGVDYINLGYKTGGQIVINKMGLNLRTTFPTDQNGDSIDKYKIMNGLNKLSDFPLLINISAGFPGIKEWVKIGQSNYGLNVVGGCTAVSAPEFYPYLGKQLQGLAGGLAGAAELEVALEKPGKAAKAMSSQSFSHAVIILFIIMANILVIVEKSQGKNA